MLYNLLSGGLLLGAFFMATDYSSSPVTLNGQLLFGFGCGALTVLIRYFGGFPEGVSFAILIMNLCAWAIDKGTRGRQFGVTKEDLKAGEKGSKGGKSIMNKIVKLTLILFLVSAIVAGILGLTNMVTEEPIRRS